MPRDYIVASSWVRPSSSSSSANFHYSVPISNRTQEQVWVRATVGVSTGLGRGWCLHRRRSTYTMESPQQQAPPPRQGASSGSCNALLQLAARYGATVPRTSSPPVSVTRPVSLSAAHTSSKQFQITNLSSSRTCSFVYPNYKGILC